MESRRAKTETKTNKTTKKI
uniref:Uncharacterized protein n=1 Tax=Anguilla anguilla TaxID=7936 RepID=A0A0E9UVH5_ANGAN